MIESAPAPSATPPPEASWLNRNVIGMTVTSFLSDAGHEMATSILPPFVAGLGLPPSTLGLIEGVSDATASMVKLASGWFSDRLGHRKAITVGGYALTGASQAIFAFAMGWPVVLLGRAVGWFGRGIRGPLRDAMLADSVAAQHRGKAFGFHRAGDTLGAVVGPLLAVLIVSALHHSNAADPIRVFRIVFLLTAVPGVLSAVVFAAVVRERRRQANRTLRFWTTLRALPARLRRALLGVGLFGLGDFSHTLMILAAVQLLTPSMGAVRAAGVAALLYVVHNITYALAPFPVGALSDSWGRRGLLSMGYALGAVVSVVLGVLLAHGLAGIAWLVFVFAAAGIMQGIVDTLEGAMIADFVNIEIRGTAYGVLGTVNGIGDLASSAIVGLLWTLHPMWGFGYAAVAMVAGAIFIQRAR